MKKISIALVWVFTLLFTVNACCEESREEGAEVQVSGYVYTKCVPLMDGYIYCMNGDRGEILKPNGHRLYLMSEYTAPYSMGYADGEKEGSLLPISYPQGERGHIFIISSPSKKAMGLINDSYEMVAPVEYDDIKPMGAHYFMFTKEDKKGILSAFSGRVVGEAKSDDDIYIGDDMLHFAFANVFTEKGKEYVNADFYTYKGDIIQSLKSEELATSPNYDSESKTFKDNSGITYRKFCSQYAYKYVEQPQKDEVSKPWEFNGYDAFKPSISGEIKSDRINPDYYFKEKKIGDKTYYAVFAKQRILRYGDKKVSYRDMYDNSDPQDKNEGAIFYARYAHFISLSQYGHFQNGISRLEFCILMINTYMRDRGLDISDYAEGVDISDIKFTDTDDVYIRLAVKLGLIDAEINSEFKPYDTITRADAAICLDRLSRLMKTRGSISSRRFPDTWHCSREQKKALKNLSKLKNANLGYVIMTEDGKFHPDDNLTAEEAYGMAYRLATYNGAGSYEYMNPAEFAGCIALCLAGIVYLIYKRKERIKKQKR